MGAVRPYLSDVEVVRVVVEAETVRDAAVAPLAVVEAARRSHLRDENAWETIRTMRPAKPLLPLD